MKKGFIWFLIAAFLLRLGYSLVSPLIEDDEIQVYLLGLKFYTTHLWPFFGPDVEYTHSQIPGALQGILVGLPLFIIPLPESPILLLNILCFGGLGLLAWYINKRLPEIPWWIVWGFVMTAPWTLRFGCRIVNPSYVQPFSILFFIGFFESSGIYKNKVINKGLAFFLMGFSMLSVMQLHLSWILLLPFILYAILKESAGRWNALAKSAAWLCSGIIVGSLLLIPTIISGEFNSAGNLHDNVLLNRNNIGNLPTILARMLSFSSYEIPYMLGEDNPVRMAVIRENPWMAPFTVILLVAGMVQVVFYIISFFLKNKAEGWHSIRWITLGAVIIVYLSFFFSVKGPSSHTYYVLMPLIMLYSFYCYNNLMRWPTAVKKAAVVLLLSGVVFHAGVGKYYFGLSIYPKRLVIEKAIKTKDYSKVGLRRADVWGSGY